MTVEKSSFDSEKIGARVRLRRKEQSG